MLLLSPAVSFGSFTFTDVVSATVSRSPVRTVTDHADTGPHVAFADVPEYQTTIRVVGRVNKDDLNVPTPGHYATLRLVTTAEGSDRPRRAVSAACTLIESRYDCSELKGCIRTLDFVAVSDGAADPISVADA